MARPPFSVNQVIQRGYQIMARHPTYSMPNRGTDMNAAQYDCSSFMGTINGIYSCPATPSMVEVYKGYGYTHLSFSGVGNLKKGDVLVYNKPGTNGAFANGHTAMYIGNGTLMEMVGNARGGCRTAPFYEYTIGNWQDVLRNPRGGIFIEHWTPTDGIADGF